MSRIAPLPESDATDKAEQTYGRLKEVLGTDAVPEPFLVMGRVPAFLQDYYMNFKKFVLGEGKLDRKTRTLVALAVAIYANSEPWIGFLRSQPDVEITDQEFADLAAVVATNNMYNTFFKFRDLAGSDVFGGMSVGLRAHTFSGVSFDERTIELIDIAISDINVCRPCTEGHVRKSRDLGLSDEQILEAVQITAVMQAGTKYLAAAGL